MASLDKFGALAAKFSQEADFTMVYIEEAHPTEEANFNGNIEISSHQNLEERLAAAGILLDKMAGRMEVDRISLLVDTMANTISKAYCALPERLYVVLDGKISYEGREGPWGYNVAEVEEHLKLLAGSKKSL